MLNLLKKLIPKSIFRFLQPAYHYALAFLGALVYGFPSKKLYVIGVTGTKGKTTTSNLIHHILNSSGFKTGLTTTVNFKIGDKEWPNTFKQTMLGRFGLQKMLSKMVKEGCKYAVIETSSEGILQYRHRFIDYNMAVFINISPEHLDRHGGFENYQAAKAKLFEKVAKKKDGIGIYNLDDENVQHFLSVNISKKYGYGLKRPTTNDQQLTTNFQSILQISNIKLNSNNSEFEANGENYKSNLIGEFNVYNTAAAICVGISQKIPTEKIKSSLEVFKTVAGRMEIMYAKALANKHMLMEKDDGSGFAIVIDYAHEPKSLEEVYKAVKQTQIKNDGNLVCVLGAAGGGRDKWKRPEMGKIAAQYCDKIILTNEDPYDENPNQILSDIKSGISNFQFPISNFHEIIDRKEAIKKAISLAKEGDAVVLTGKGGEVWMCIENNKKISWDEKKIVKEILLG